MSEKIKIPFISNGVVCQGYLYLPEPTPVKPGVIIMANGFSGTQDWILPDFAERFVKEGFAVYTFDYRYLGESGGEPRQLITTSNQRADLKKAIECIKTRTEIDPYKIILWGTSLGGNYVIQEAAEDEKIAGVIAVMPALDVVKGMNLEAKKKQQNISQTQVYGTTFNLFKAAVIDQVRGWFGKTPNYIQVYGKPGEAFFTDPALASNFKTLQEKSRFWKNKVTPRFLFTAPIYKEGTMQKILKPILICLADGDTEISNDFVKEKARKVRLMYIKEYPVDHFQMYHGETLDWVAQDQIQFLKQIAF